MKVFPNNIIERSEINLRLGIKSSLPDVYQFLGTFISFYLVNSENSVLEYSTENGNDIVIVDNLYELLENFFHDNIVEHTITDFRERINSTPFFKSQIEALQVAMNLYWKLGQINFVDPSFNVTQERTGNVRYNKYIQFSSNTIILINTLTNIDNSISTDLKNILFNWIMNNSYYETNNELQNKILMTLSIFSEETQFKIKNEENEDLIFQQENIYSEIVSGNTVESKGNSGPVGPFRILKKIVSKGLHPFLKDDNEFDLKDGIGIDQLQKYKDKVSTYLDLITRRTILENDSYEGMEEFQNSDGENTIPENVIFFGSPGTGKSYSADEKTNGHIVEKTTFHPEYDYNSFVGGYKPIMNEDGEDSKIEYKFVPQIFTNVYVNAWKDLESHHFLQIEEINRGNCAEIFGDLFQLLDRDNEGKSKYEISASEELKTHLIKEFGDAEHEGIRGNKLRLPSNLSIVATMNTSDQSLFPMDSAFKRRWNWEYVPIKYNCEDSDFTIKLDNDKEYNWLDFLKEVNQRIYKATQSQDKQIGNWFINAQNTENIINEKTFINKVVFYLWNDVFKDEDETIFIKEEEPLTYEHFFAEDKTDLLEYIFTTNLNLEPITETTTDEEEVVEES